jgi:hypothetical protein
VMWLCCVIQGTFFAAAKPITRRKGDVMWLCCDAICCFVHPLHSVSAEQSPVRDVVSDSAFETDNRRQRTED